MRPLALVASLLIGTACGHGSEPAKGSTGSAAVIAAPAPTTPAPMAPASTAPTAPAAAGSAVAVTPAAAPPPVAPPPVAAAPAAEGVDFTAAARALIAVGACGDVPAPDGFDLAAVATHCAAIRKTQAEYKQAWVERARPFFAEKVPASVPKKVVYPFAGGDLSTALTVYPDADEITTLSLEPAGDPRTLAAMTPSPGAAAAPGKRPRPPKPSPALVKALDTIRFELRFLYKVNFSNTMNMIQAMRGGALPTQLVFGLSALQVHGFEVVGLRYFRLADDGAIQYLTDDDVARAPEPTKGKADARNRVFANAELRFRRPGGRIQVYRHLQVNLDDAHLKKDPRVIKHLEAKGPIAGMTKAASYLLSWPEFSTIRGYLMRNVAWMVSDATGIPPRHGTPAGFTYETYGAFQKPHIDAGDQIAADWRKLWTSQPRRALKFRFGYHDGSDGHTNHLVIMRKAG